MRSKSLSMIAATLLLAASGAYAGSPQYTNPRFAEITRLHTTLALLPFEVSIGPEGLSKNVTAEMVRKEEGAEGLDFQKRLYARFCKRLEEGKYYVTFLDVDRTNALLGRAGITPENAAEHTPSEIAKVLGVDAVMSGTILRARPTSSSPSTSMGVIGGGTWWGNTERADVSISIRNGEDGALLWSYEQSAAGGASNTPEAMVRSLVKDVAGQFPYRVAGRQEQVAGRD